MVEGALIERFGPYAGWAHNTLFIAELSSHKVPRCHCANGRILNGSV